MGSFGFVGQLWVRIACSKKVLISQQGCLKRDTLHVTHISVSSKSDLRTLEVDKKFLFLIWDFSKPFLLVLSENFLKSNQNEPTHHRSRQRIVA